MAGFFTEIMYKILVFLMTLGVACSGTAAPSTDDPIKAQDEENLKLSVVFWGDTQVSDYMFSRAEALLASCEDVSNAQGRVDVLTIAGDIVENGKGSEYRVVLDYLALCGNVGHILPATGNHDVRLRYFPQTVKNFAEFANTCNSSLELDRLYYSYEAEGYTFFILGTISSTFEEADIDEEELKWLDAGLASAATGEKPVFVVLHQPLKDTHNLPDAWNSPFDWAGSVGKNSDDIKDILSKYENVYLLTGHLHSGLGENNFEKINSFVSVNAPSVGIVSKDDGYEANGTGYMIEVYEHSVVFRARDFANGTYLPELGIDKTFEF